MQTLRLNSKTNYKGLYIFDFGDSIAVGYTAKEIAALLESDEYSDGKVYKIINIDKNGKCYMKGIPNELFQLENGFFFCSQDAESAEGDFSDLWQLAEKEPPPCTCKIHLSKLNYSPMFSHVVALIFPAEYEDDISKWLIKIDYKGGESVDCGISHVTNYYNNGTVSDARQFFVQDAESRTYELLMESVGEALQR